MTFVVTRQRAQKSRTEPSRETGCPTPTAERSPSTEAVNELLGPGPADRGLVRRPHRLGWKPIWVNRQPTTRPQDRLRHRLPTASRQRPRRASIQARHARRAAARRRCQLTHRVHADDHGRAGRSGEDVRPRRRLGVSRQQPVWHRCRTVRGRTRMECLSVPRLLVPRRENRGVNYPGVPGSFSGGRACPRGGSHHGEGSADPRRRHQRSATPRTGLRCSTPLGILGFEAFYDRISFGSFKELLIDAEFETIRGAPATFRLRTIVSLPRWSLLDWTTTAFAMRLVRLRWPRILCSWQVNFHSLRRTCKRP